MGQSGNSVLRPLPFPIVLGGLFILVLLSAWAWFHLAVPSSKETWRFEVRPAVEGWSFQADPLSDGALSLLATTNIVNGNFTNLAGDRITIFAAEWSAKDGVKLDVVSHTPDVCWVGVGWIPVSAGQPQKSEVKLDGGAASFECRVFQNPSTREREVVLWATLLNGQIVDEGALWSSEIRALNTHDTNRRFDSARRRAGNLFVSALRERRAATGNKQFVRLSIRADQGWEGPVEALRHFAADWISLETAKVDSSR